jgi:hypothetical protein
MAEMGSGDFPSVQAQDTPIPDQAITGTYTFYTFLAWENMLMQGLLWQTRRLRPWSLPRRPR